MAPPDTTQFDSRAREVIDQKRAWFEGANYLSSVLIAALRAYWLN
jgi:hypothetical protein